MASDHPVTTADKLLDCLLYVGIDYVFANLGTDHVPIIEALAKRRQDDRPSPEFILCPHENIAIHMALGYAAATGRGQAVMVHVDAGTANAAMGVQNAARTRLPVLLMAGKAPFDVQGAVAGGRDNYVHFMQDPFDITSLVRAYVKWDYVLMSDVNLNEVMRRAHSVMQATPPGPVYMVMPREILAAPAPYKEQVFPAEQFGSTELGGLTSAQLSEIGDRLFRSKSPLVVTSYLGRDESAPAILKRFCDVYGARVVEANPTHMNFDRSDVWATGFDATRHLDSSDLILMVDTDVPWLPKFAAPRPEVTCIHLDIDAGKSDFPMWGFAADIRVQTNTLIALSQLSEYGEQTASDDFKVDIAQRRERLIRSAASVPAAKAPPAGGAPDAKLILSTLNGMLAKSDIVVNEAIRNAPVVLNAFPRTEPGTYFSNAGGGLGASGGWALGLKLACPTRRVVQIVGDGSFHFCTPTSLFAVARSRRLPILTIVLNNGGWQAVKEAVLRMYPEGDAFQLNAFEAGLGSTDSNFAMVAEAFGAKGYQISTTTEARTVFDAALNDIDGGTAVLIDVKLPSIA